MRRPFLEGAQGLSLVGFPVELYTAPVGNARVRFHQFDRTTRRLAAARSST